MKPFNRREFLGDVGRGMLVAGVGASLAADLGLAPAWANEGSDQLSLGALDGLVALMEQTPVDQLQPLLVGKLRSGEVDLRQLVAAAALANARSFGGENYVGFHTAMALVPAWQMTRELPADRQALPVLKVLYRNTNEIQNTGCHKNPTLQSVQPAEIPADSGGERLRDLVRGRQRQEAEGLFAGLCQRDPNAAYNDLQFIIHDDINVHRVVLAHRAWALVDVVGIDQAHTLLRQCVRFCIEREEGAHERNQPAPAIRTILPRMLDQYNLAGREPGSREADDAWIDEMGRLIYFSTNDQAADAVAAALAEGFSPESVGEAISLAANQLVLRDRESRTHGDSIGVHASDSANAWRNIARVTNARHTFASLIVGAYHVCEPGERPQEPFPLPEHRELVAATDPGGLLAEAEDAIRNNDQPRAAAAIQIYGEGGHPERPVFDLLLRYALSEDGRLHGEKYYRTVSEEFQVARPAFKWRHLVALARVTASAYGFDREDRHGYRAPGYEEACRLLGV